MAIPNQPSLDTIVALCKRRGFVYPTSELYGGLTSSYDYGPMGVEVLRHIRELWWKRLVTDRDDMVGLDSQILLHPQTWVASGHVESFHDPLVEDIVTHKRYRADHLIEAWLEDQPSETVDRLVPNSQVENLSLEQMAILISDHSIPSPEGHSVTKPKQFNLLFETAIGSVSDDKTSLYLRGETAQGIFTNFKQVVNSTRVRLPFGIGQIGRSFRNEITTGQFVFRTLEFEQAEIEYFFDPNDRSWRQLFESWQQVIWQFVTETLGVSPKNLRWRRHTDAERSHYSQETFDLDYRFPFGWKELWGLAYRGDYDLRQHAQTSGQDLSYTYPNTSRSLFPHVIEPAVSTSRLFLSVMIDAYQYDTEHQRVLLQLHPDLAPYRVAVFPLLKNKRQLVELARRVYRSLQPQMSTTWDERGNIGKRYLYQDEIGTPYCLTIDYQSLDDGTVTVRHRDTTEQVRVSIDVLVEYLFRSNPESGVDWLRSKLSENKAAESKLTGPNQTGEKPTAR